MEHFKYHRLDSVADTYMQLVTDPVCDVQARAEAATGKPALLGALVRGAADALRRARRALRDGMAPQPTAADARAGDRAGAEAVTALLDAAQLLELAPDETLASHGVALRAAIVAVTR